MYLRATMDFGFAFSGGVLSQRFTAPGSGAGTLSEVEIPGPAKEEIAEGLMRAFSLAALTLRTTGSLERLEFLIVSPSGEVRRLSPICLRLPIFPMTEFRL
jgi:hypothetical protein